MPNSHVIRQVLLGLLTLFILLCILSCQSTERKKLISIRNAYQSPLFLTVEPQKTYAAIGGIAAEDFSKNWKEWVQKSYIPIEGLQTVEIPLAPGIYNWYMVLPFKVIRGGSFQVSDELEEISTDSSEVLFDYRKDIQGAYLLNCSLHKLNESQLKIEDSTFSYVVNVHPSSLYANQIEVENRSFPLNNRWEFDFREGPIDLVTGRFLPKKDELRMKVTTKEQIVPFRTCNCVGKKIEVYETEKK